MIAGKEAIRTAYSYIRFSTPEQAQGWSEERQRAKSKKLADKNGWSLDGKFKLFDKGRSAFHKGYQHDLAKFLAAVKKGDIRPNSILIVERLDRLSRQSIMNALRLFEEIIRAGIDIATIDPERIYTTQTLEEPFALLEPLLQFTLNNMESTKKQEHSKDNWEAARKAARETGKPIPGMMPVWLKLIDGKYIVDKEKAKTIKVIFNLAAKNGWGAKRIIRYLHEKGIPNIAFGTRTSAKATWNTTMIRNILTSRVTIGEYQPCRIVDKRQVPDGDPIPDFYPAVVEEALFYAAQAAGAKNKTNKGRPGRRTVNLFTGLLFDARTHDTFRVLTSIPKTPRNGRGLHRITRLCSWHNDEPLSWKYEDFEQGFLKFLSEVTFDDVQPSDDVSELNSLRGELSEVTANIEKTLSLIVGGSQIDSLQDLLSRLDARKKELVARIEDIKIVSAGRTATTTDVVDLADLLAATPENKQQELRDRIKGAIEAGR